jgi:hypothetical protein
MLRFDGAVTDYIHRMSAVHGWLDKFSAEAIATLSQEQVRRGYRGSVCEIGIHHGKLFFVLYLTTSKGEKAIAIDVFGDQHLNTDLSGRGDKAIFLRHARRWSADCEGLEVIQDSSLNVSTDQLGKVRFFSIDGGHTEEATTNDLRLADASMTEEGILVIDDVFHPYFPEVAVAFAKFMLGAPGLAPFALTPGKVFLSRQKFSPVYAGLLTTQYRERFQKTANFYGHEVAILGVLPEPWRRRFGRTKTGLAIKRMLQPLRGAHA